MQFIPSPCPAQRSPREIRYVWSKEHAVLFESARVRLFYKGLQIKKERDVLSEYSDLLIISGIPVPGFIPYSVPV